MDEFGGSKEVEPFLGVIGAEDLEISLNLLISSLGLSIGLGVICGREANIVSKDVSEFPSKGRGKLWASIGDNGVMKSEVFEYKVEKELSYSIGINSFKARSKDYPLCKAMVNHDHQGVKTIR